MQLASATFMGFLWTIATAASSAWACSCGSIAPENILEYGDMIAEGTVVSTTTTPATPCVAAAKEMESACGTDADSDCRGRFEERMFACGAPLILHDITTAEIHLSDVWKGPTLLSLTLRYTEASSGMCGMTLQPGERFGFIAYRTEMDSWKTSECLTFRFGTLSAGDGPFGRVAQPILERYRSKLEQTTIDPGGNTVFPVEE